MISFIKKVWRIFRPFYKKMIRDNIFAIAGQTAFFLLLSSVPLSMFIVSMLQSLHIPVEIIEDSVSAVLSKEASTEIANFMINMYENTVSISLITIIGTLWSAAQGIHAITNGLNRVHHTYENRNWFLLRLRAMVYTVVLFVIILATMVIVVLGSTIDDLIRPYLPNLPDIISLVYHLRYVIIFLYLVVLFALVYRNLPNLSREKRKEYGFRSQLPGALFCAASWFVLALGISIYVNDFNGYSIYGAMARIIVVMVWLYFCMVCLMIGAEFNVWFHSEINWLLNKLRIKRQRKKQIIKNK